MFLLISLLLLCLARLTLMFEILIISTVTNDYSALCHAFFEKSSVCLVSHHILSLCLRFQPSLLLQEVSCLLCCSSCFVSLFEVPAKSISTSCYLISCSIPEKIFCLHPQIFNSGAQIFLVFVYNAWEW